MDKIIIINHYGITPDMPGPTKHYDLAKYFSLRHEFNVEFWMCGFNHHTGQNTDTLKGFKLSAISFSENLKLIKIKGIPYRHSSILRQFNHMVFDFITAVKILFSRNIKCVILSVPPISIFNVVATKIKGIRLITDVEDLWPLFLEDMGMKNKLVVSYMETLANYTYNASDGIDAVSEGMLNFVKGKLKKGKKRPIMWLAPLGVNLEIYDKAKATNVFKKYVWKDDFKILYIGAHGRANDIESVLKAIKALNKIAISIEAKNISFVFIGDGDNKKRLVALRRKLGLNNVYFEDAIPSTEVPSFLKNADVCLTNLKKIESFKLVRPNKIFQYMAAKAPIICGIWGESKKIIEESGAGIYVDFTDSVKAVHNILDFILNTEKLRACREKGYKYICKYGDRNKIFESFYEKTKKIIKK